MFRRLHRAGRDRGGVHPEVSKLTLNLLKLPHRNAERSMRANVSRQHAKGRAWGLCSLKQVKPASSQYMRSRDSPIPAFSFQQRRSNNLVFSQTKTSLTAFQAKPPSLIGIDQGETVTTCSARSRTNAPLSTKVERLRHYAAFPVPELLSPEPIVTTCISLARE